MPKKKRKKKVHKGFTLIEILAAITILGIITGIAIVSVTKIIADGKKEHYDTAEENLSLAGQSYVQQNRAALPKAIGQKKIVQLSTLVDSKYIQPIKDYSDKDCDLSKSYVQVYKYSQSDYSYVAYLECPGYTSEDRMNSLTPEINAVINVDEEKSTATANITINGNDKLMSYSYIIYRGSKEVKNTGSVTVKGYKSSVTLNLPLTDYTPGKIKIVITAANIYGNTKTVTVSKDIADTKAPNCIIAVEDQQPKATWINTNRKITVGCDDGDGSGCKRETYTKTFKTTADYGVITISDEAGNTNDCRVSVYVDKTAPKCTNTGDSTTWINTDRTITWGCEDTASGCHTSFTGGSQVFNTTTKTSTIAAYTIKDNAGNETTCAARSAKVYVDKTAPSCSVSGGNASWTNGSRTISAKCEDTDSGCDTADFSKSYTTEMDITTAGAKGNNNGGTVKDKAGNETACAANQTVKIDKTAPSCSVSGGNTSWTNGNRTITATCTDLGGSGCATASFSKTYNTNTNTTTAGAVGNSSGGSVSDNAGNTTNCAANQTVKIDKAAPTCTSSGGSTSWTNGNRTLTGTCSDTGGSGCKANVSVTYSTNTNSSNLSPGTVYDAAGNSVTCPANQTVKIDKTAPTCTSSGGSTSWTNGNRTLTGTCTDTGGSGCQGNVSKSYTSNTNASSQSPGTVYDYAGNSVACPANQTVKIDKTAPTCGSVSGASTSYTTGSRTVSVACSDTGGSGCTASSYSNTWSSGHVTTSTIGIRDNAGNTRSCSVNVYRKDISVSFSGYMGYWVAAEYKTSCSSSYRAMSGGSCIVTYGSKYGNNVVRATASASGLTVTFNWTVVNGASTYICGGYSADIKIKNSSGTVLKTVTAKADYDPRCWNKGETHSGSFSYTFPGAGTYYIYMDGETSSPSYDVTLGTITIS